MNSRTRYQNLLRRHGCGENVVKHCTAVSKKALELADALNIPVNRDLVFVGAMLHDIGRCRTHDIEHITVGAKIAREEGLSDEVANMIERHVGAGITKKEAEALGLPSKDYTPITPEEVIVSLADNLTNGTAYLTFPEALQRFKRRLGENHPAVERFRKQYEQVQRWTRKS